jgi:ketol-acid reductoisomerase
VDLIYSGGLSNMLQAVSETARYGGLTRGPRVIDEHVRDTMKRILDEIVSGEFAKEWTGDISSSRARMNELVDAVKNHEIEKVGAQIRRMLNLGEAKA